MCDIKPHMKRVHEYKKSSCNICRFHFCHRSCNISHLKRVHKSDLNPIVLSFTSITYVLRSCVYALLDMGKGANLQT